MKYRIKRQPQNDFRLPFLCREINKSVVITYGLLFCVFDNEWYHSLCEQPAHNAFIFRKSHTAAVLISETSFGEIVLFLYIKDEQLADLI